MFRRVKLFWLLITTVSLMVLIPYSFSDDIETSQPLVCHSGKRTQAADMQLPDATLARKTTAGTVIGFFDVYNTLAWLGIPYAKPPIGDLRWRAPQDPSPWNDPLDASEYESPCPQYCSILAMDKENLGKTSGNEDCLYLNVWRPNTHEKLPVYFWIHGGGNSIGRTMDYNWAYFAEKANAVFVCPAYRIGPFGWFRHPSLDDRIAGSGNPLDTSGNFGTLDLIKALEWVRDNIAQFGGDPDNVTVSGQSGGGANVFSLLLSPKIKYDENGKENYLFHKAICQNGRLKIYSHTDAEKSAHEVITRLLVHDHVMPDQTLADRFISNPENSAYIADYLLSKSADDILEIGYDTSATGMLDFPRLFDDGNVIVSNAEKAFTKGHYYQIPMIIGDNADDAKLFLALKMSNLTAEELIDVILNFDPDHPDITMKNLVSSPRLYDMVASAINNGTHWMFIERIVRVLSRHHNTYVYQFLWDNEPEPFNDLFGACHAVELPFFTGNFNMDTHYFRVAWSQDNKEEVADLSEAMIAYWRNFIWTGDPNSNGLITWKPWTNTFGGRQRLILDADIHMTNY